MIITGKYPNLRMRRSRKTDWSRRLVQENNLSYNDLILPVFITDGSNKKISIKTMPGVYRYSIDRLGHIVDKSLKKKIPMIAIFPQTNSKLKDSTGSEALNDNNLVCRAIKYIKKKYKNEIGIMCDVALDPYTSHGHDGLLKNKNIVNDETVDVLVQQSILQASMGCDVIAPSDMMDGRIGKIRSGLDKYNLKDVQIISYAVKYASSYYGPFRDAVGSKGALKGDKKTYQMDFHNRKEAISETLLDIDEGADIVIVKPGIFYLDIISDLNTKINQPIAAYQVSGEYAMLKAAQSKGWIDYDSVIYENLIAFKRAGCSMIITYCAKDIARILNSRQN